MDNIVDRNAHVNTPADRPLRALLVEDSERDAELLLRALRRGGYDVSYERVDTADAMSAALAGKTWDVILCDYAMPRFDVRAALALMRGAGLDLPFIIVSGSVGEETAVDSMRAGVHDYFLKSRLGPRLVAAIEREVREAANRAERRRMQEQLMISERMVSMGMLAAAVAHEINNPLAAMVINLDVAAKHVASEQLTSDAERATLREQLEDARTAAERITNIVRDLKVFSRTTNEPTTPVHVGPIVESTVRMARNEINHRARLVIDLGSVPLVDASESRLGQVFLNLIVNAVQAIPEGRAAENEVGVRTRTGEDGRVMVEIWDTGAGMSPDVVARLFKPFFTTKPVGIGSGLGLSICHRIITELGGTITVTSEIGKGSTFQVSLPPAAKGTEKPAVEPQSATQPAVRRGRILVIDDEPMIGRAIKRALSSEHDVTSYTDGKEALEKLRAGEQFDVILCDLMMPHMTGMDVHDALSRFAPEVAERIIFLTGGAFTPRAHEFLDNTHHLRIDKPIEFRHLRATINARIR